MSDQRNFLYLEPDPYSRFQSAELNLNNAITRARIDESFEELLEIFDKFYSEDVEVSLEEMGEPVRGKTRVGSILMNFLVPLHVLAEVGGLKVSIRQTGEPSDVPDETNSSWRLELVGSSGKTCTPTWRTFREWNDGYVVGEHHYQSERTGDPPTSEDLNLFLPSSSRWTADESPRLLRAPTADWMVSMVALAMWWFGACAKRWVSALPAFM